MALFSGLIAGLTATFTSWGIGATFAAGLSSFLIKTAAQVATSALVRLILGPQQQNRPAFSVTGKLQAGDAVPRQFPMGKAMTAGSLVYDNTWGAAGDTPNAYLAQVIALSDLPVKGLLSVMVDGAYVTLEATAHADLGYPVLEYRVDGTDYLWVKFYDGTQTTADAFLVSNVSTTERPYESTRVGYGIAYAICHARINSALFSGFPAFRFLLDSVKLYDPSKDTTVGGSGSQRWATPSTWGGDGDYLPAVQAYNLMRGISYDGDWLYGFQGVSEYRLPVADWIDAIADCRATVTEHDGAQPRWRAGGMLSVDAECGTALEQVMAACSGRIAEAGGSYKPTVGGSYTSVASLTDDDFLITEEQSLIPFKGLAGIINAVAASYPEPEEGFNMKSAPLLTDAAYETADGGRRLMSSLALPNVPYAEQVQRLQKAALTEARKERRHTGVLGPAWIGLEPNDVVSWTSDRNGYSAKLFRVDAVLDRPDAHVLVDLSEVDSTDYDWTTASDYTDQDKVPAAMVRPSAQSLTGFSVAQATLDVGGNGSQPGISFSWTADDIEDATGIRYQVRLTSSGVVKARGTTADVDALDFIIPHAFKASTSYEVRARPIIDRETAWTAWTAITTNASALTTADISGYGTTFSDASFTLQDDGDPTKQAKFQLSTITTGSTRTFTLPDTTGTLVLNNQTTTTLSNVTTSATLNIGAGVTASGNTKTANLATAGASGSTTNINVGSSVSGALGTLTINSPTVAFGATVTAINLPDAATFLTDNLDATKKAQFQLSTITTGTTRTVTLPDASGTMAMIDVAQTWGAAQTFTDNAFMIRDNADTTKAFVFQASAISTGTTRTVNIPDIGGGVIIMDTGTQTIGGNKTFSNAVGFPASTVAGLPAATTPYLRAFVTNSNATLAAGLGNIVAGGGANIVPVYSDGTNWRIG